MKRILLIADTHRNVLMAQEIVRRSMPLDGLVHLGDCVEDAYELRDAFGLDLWVVSGNHDWYDKEPGERVFDIEDVRFFACHGDRYELTAYCPDSEWESNMTSMLHRAAAERCHCVLFGHSHVALKEFRDSVLVINPGSVCLGEKEVGYGILEITGDRVTGRLYRTEQDRNLLTRGKDKENL